MDNSPGARGCATCFHVALAANAPPCDTCFNGAGINVTVSNWTPKIPPVTQRTDDESLHGMSALNDGVDHDAIRLQEKRNFRTHLLWTNKDADPPKVICDANGSVVLALCKVCNRGEAELYEAACVRPVRAAAHDMPDAPPTRGEAPAVTSLGQEAATRTAADILAEMAETFRERNATYGQNWRMVAPLVKVLFPDGVPPELVVTHQWHLFELILVKLSRFAISNLTHVDSAHDGAVYFAMCEMVITNKENEK